MAGVSRLFSLARQLGDASSLVGGQGVDTWGKRVANVKARGGRRIGGRALAGTFRMNIWGLILWGEFLNEFRNQIQLYNAREVWLGSALVYAGLYELGFQRPSGGHRRREWFFPAVQQALLERKFGSGFDLGISGFSRSGLYESGRFVADLRAIKGGIPTLGARAIRRSTGKQASRLFWGTLRNPKFNVLHAIAMRAQVLAQQNLESQGLVASGMLKASVALGNTFDEMVDNSRQGVLKAAGGSVPGFRKFGGNRLPG